MMSRPRRNRNAYHLALASAAVIGLAAAGGAHADDDHRAPTITRHVVYVESNDPQANGILAYAIADDGSLHPLAGSPFATGGTGVSDPSFALGPFDNDQQLAEP